MGDSWGTPAWGDSWEDVWGSPGGRLEDCMGDYCMGDSRSG